MTVFNFQVVITFPESSVKSDKVAIRGPKEDVDSCSKYLAQLNKELLASNYRAEVPIFKNFHKFIIGKDGANIRKVSSSVQFFPLLIDDQLDSR